MQVMDATELAALSEHLKYIDAVKRAAGAKTARVQKSKDLKDARLLARVWERKLRSLYRHVFEYTASLRWKENPKTGKQWTDAERTKEGVETYVDACLHLLAGMVDHPSLKRIKHPATKQLREEFSWKAPVSNETSNPHTPLSPGCKYPALSCYAMLCYATLCCATLCYAMLCCGGGGGGGGGGGIGVWR